MNKKETANVNKETGAENKKETKSLDAAMGEIREIIMNMENPDCSLEKSFELYKEGIELLKFCNDSIDKVEKELEILNS